MLVLHCQLRRCSGLKFNKLCLTWWIFFLFFFGYEYVCASLPHFACSHPNPVNEDVLWISWLYLDSFVVFIAKTLVSQHARHIWTSPCRVIGISLLLYLSLVFILYLIDSSSLNLCCYVFLSNKSRLFARCFYSTLWRSNEWGWMKDPNWFLKSIIHGCSWSRDEEDRLKGR